jgi:hypothetical protein
MEKIENTGLVYKDTSWLRIESLGAGVMGTTWDSIVI